jgi:PadR family transcriptional regulator, regulatory protein AphA
MSLPHIILGLLQQQSMTGYDLKNSCFDKSIAHLWAADQAQIYRTLDKLVEQLWVVYEVQIQQDRPNRKVYSLTTAGKAELWRWLQESQPLPPLREPLLVQLFLAQSSELTDEIIVNLLKQQLTAHQEKMSCYQLLEQQPEVTTDSAIDQQSIIRSLVIELLIEKEKTYIDWLIMIINRFSPFEN